MTDYRTRRTNFFDLYGDTDRAQRKGERDSKRMNDDARNESRCVSRGKRRVVVEEPRERGKSFEDAVANGCRRTSESLLRLVGTCAFVEVKVAIDVRTPRPHPSMFVSFGWLAELGGIDTCIASLNIE